MLVRSDRGDTIVEAVIAFAIFSAVAVGSLLIMNQGVAMAQRSLEVTLVRQQMDAQGEMLRYIRDSQPIEWAAITAVDTVTTTPAPLSGGTDVCAAPSDRAFFLTAALDTNPSVLKTATSGTYLPPTTYAQVDHVNSQSYGLWVESTKAQGNAVDAYDFRIHACWQAVGGSVPVTLGTIVRLYEKS